MDERYDTVRAVRDRRFRYVRNYAPHRPWGQHYSYPFRVQPSMRSWHAEFLAGRCNDAQAAYWGEKPGEELYLLDDDPFEQRNRIDDPELADELHRLRASLREEILRTRDAGFLPEGLARQLAGEETIYEYVQSEDYPLERILEVADRASDRDARHLPQFLADLEDPHPAIRYWAATGCLILKEHALPARDKLLARLQDEFADVRIVAAEAVAWLGESDSAKRVIAGELEGGLVSEVLAALNSLDAMRQAGQVSLDEARRLVHDRQYEEPADRIPRYILSTEVSRPNVVVFLADDAGWGDFSYSGNRQVATPHIDSIARQGVSLERFYVCPVCSPTRAEFLTGRYHPRGGVRGVSTGQERLDLSETTIAEAFQAAGYATGCFGKWHNGSQWPYHPMARGFDEYFGHTAGHWGEYFDPPLEENGRMVRTQGYIVDVCTERALEFINRNRERPFFCYVPFTTPHSPWAVPDKYWRRFQDLAIAQRATDPELEDLDHTRCALAMMENQDWNVGRVLSKLEELGLADDTIVVYFSDNGPNSFRWNGGMKGRKGSTDEGGVRSVCYVRWPRQLPAGHTVPQISAALDLLPTLTSLAGIDRIGPLPLDGSDLSPLLAAEEVDWPDREIFSTWAGRISVRTQRYRLDHDGELYDMVEDPGQTSPVTAKEPDVAARLAAAVQSWREEMFPESERGTTLASNAVDPRPIPVGYREFPITMLPARDGEPQGSVQRSSPAPNCSYFVHWSSSDDRMVWRLDVQTAGQYEVVIDYTCPEEDAGAVMELVWKGSRLRGRVAPGWDPPLFTNQDTLPRPAAESRMKEFRPLPLGTMHLEAGTGELVLRAVEIPGSSVMDVRRLTLTLLDDSRE
jgi:arylsulfatase A-like enzyme